jgi:hypothetical protein
MPDDVVEADCAEGIEDVTGIAGVAAVFATRAPCDVPRRLRRTAMNTGGYCRRPSPDITRD